MPDMKRNDEFDARRRRDHGSWLIDNRWRRRCHNDGRRRRFIDDGRRGRRLIHDGWRRRLVDDRGRTLTLIGVMLAPFTALVLAPLVFAPPMVALVIIGAGWVRAHSA